MQWGLTLWWLAVILEPLMGYEPCDNICAIKTDTRLRHSSYSSWSGAEWDEIFFQIIQDKLDAADKYQETYRQAWRIMKFN